MSLPASSKEVPLLSWGAAWPAAFQLPGRVSPVVDIPESSFLYFLYHACNKLRIGDSHLVSILLSTLPLCRTRHERAERQGRDGGIETRMEAGLANVLICRVGICWCLVNWHAFIFRGLVPTSQAEHPFHRVDTALPPSVSVPTAGTSEQAHPEPEISLIRYSVLPLVTSLRSERARAVAGMLGDGVLSLVASESPRSGNYECMANSFR